MTPTTFVPQIRQALLVKKLPVPVVYNTSGYERVETCAAWRPGGHLPARLQIRRPGPGEAALHAEDYPQAARAAIREMVRQVGPPFTGRTA